MYEEEVQRGADRGAASSVMSQGKATPLACREVGISQQSCATNASTEKPSTA